MQENEPKRDGRDGLHKHPMNIHNIVDKIIHIPTTFENHGNIKSAYSLLEETGYFEIYNRVHEDVLRLALEQHPECINSWLIWSENKRADCGWYFRQNDYGKYVVGYFPKTENATEYEYADIKFATAAFIKHEIEEIRRI